MKHLVAAGLLAILMGGALAEVGVSVNIGHPGFYGRLDVGDYPPPPLIYPQPLVIQPVPPGAGYAPIYMRVPPGHARHWARHCQRYRACGRPVYFVQDRWYRDVYVPRYRERSPPLARRYDERPYRPRHYPEHYPGRIVPGGPDVAPGPPFGRGPIHAPHPGYVPGRLPGPP